MGLRIFVIPLDEPVGPVSRLMNRVEATVVSIVEGFPKNPARFGKTRLLILVDVEVVFAPVAVKVTTLLVMDG